MRETNKNNTDESLNALRQAFASDPTNLLAVERYWQALGKYKGHDVRSGQDVIQAYRSAALDSHQGAAALAQAYRELFETSGEAPRAAYFDDDLIQALERWYHTAPAAERSNIGWILEKIDHRQ